MLDHRLPRLHRAIPLFLNTFTPTADVYNRCTAIVNHVETLVIAEGYAADLCIWSLDSDNTVDVQLVKNHDEALHLIVVHVSLLSLYSGMIQFITRLIELNRIKVVSFERT